LFVSFAYATIASADLLTIRDKQFEYVENLAPYRTFPCSSEKASVGFYEWDVDCSLPEKKIRFWVHLSLREYGKTPFGENSYELLYWVTQPDSNDHRHSSTSLWIHNSEASNRLKRLSNSLGVEEDRAYLKLTLAY